MLDSWPKIKGKCCVTEDDLQRARAIAEALLAFVGARELSPEATAEALDIRNRMFTLLYDNYDVACRAITFVRWPHGDADKVAPSLYPERRRSRKDADAQDDTAATQPGATPAVVSAPTNGTAPVVANNTTAPLNVSVGRPNSNPFMS